MTSNLDRFVAMFYEPRLIEGRVTMGRWIELTLGILVIGIGAILARIGWEIGGRLWLVL